MYAVCKEACSKLICKRQGDRGAQWLSGRMLGLKSSIQERNSKSIPILVTFNVVNTCVIMSTV